LNLVFLTAQDIRALFRSEEWIAIESRKAQLVFVEEFAQKDCGVTIDTTCLAEIFEMSRSRVRTNRATEATTASPSSGTL
jgi:hypothetical protein